MWFPCCNSETKNQLLNIHTSAHRAAITLSNIGRIKNEEWHLICLRSTNPWYWISVSYLRSGLIFTWYSKKQPTFNAFWFAGSRSQCLSLVWLSAPSRRLGNLMGSEFLFIRSGQIFTRIFQVRQPKFNVLRFCSFKMSVLIQHAFQRCIWWNQISILYVVSWSVLGSPVKQPISDAVLFRSF